MTSQRKITAILAAKAGKGPELEQLIASMVQACRAEPGNVRFDVWQDRDDPTRFVLDELYADDDAVAAHRESPHFLNYAARIGDIAVRTPVVSRPYDVLD
jgi:quinol monooxygenase YgiN